MIDFRTLCLLLYMVLLPASPVHASCPKVLKRGSVIQSIIEWTRFTFSKSNLGILIHDSKWDGDAIAEVRYTEELGSDPKPEPIFKGSLKEAELEKDRKFSEQAGTVQRLKDMGQSIFYEHKRPEEHNLTGIGFIGGNLGHLFLGVNDGYLVYDADGVFLEKLRISWPGPSQIQTSRRMARRFLGEYLRYFYDRDPRQPW